jgi:D-alanyl-D-alanine carboxypeptidase/D-alanyl-D-alanine-endopeptidase (penicillin-binding protein 4)
VTPRFLVPVIVLACCLASAAGAAPSGAGSLHRKLAGTFDTPGVLSNASTAMVVELPTGRVVFARNAGLSLEPASNEKLSVTYSALLELGPSYRYPTELIGEGKRVGSTWVGRLVLKGFGDPALTTSDLQHLAKVVWRMGIRRITGGIVGDASFFDRKTTAAGWLPSFAGVESPPMSALIVDRAARNGRLVSNPALAAAAELDRLLHARGIVARGASTGRAWPRARPVATIYSEPLSEILQFMDHYSDNFTAEMVLKAIGAKSAGYGTTAGGAIVVRRDLGAAGVPLGGVRIADGSGLSRDDRVTAHELASILVLIWNSPVMRPVVWDALPIAGESGTLQNRLLDNPAHALVRAKTGTTDIASALSGYVGKRYAFVAIENGDPVDYWAAHTAEDGIAEALIDQIHTA